MADGDPTVHKRETIGERQPAADGGPEPASLRTAVRVSLRETERGEREVRQFACFSFS